jgi:hypothetical protein
MHATIEERYGSERASRREEMHCTDEEGLEVPGAGRVSPLGGLETDLHA